MQLECQFGKPAVFLTIAGGAAQNLRVVRACLRTLCAMVELPWRYFPRWIVVKNLGRDIRPVGGPAAARLGLPKTGRC